MDGVALHPRFHKTEVATMKREHFKELRVRLYHDELWLLRAKAAQSGMSVPQYMRKILNEEPKTEEKKDRYRIF